MVRFEIEKGFHQSIDVSLIRSSFNPARYMGVVSIEKAYEFLFTDYPEGLPTFDGVVFAKQYQAMLNGLSFVVDHLDNEEALRKYLFVLGQRHREYGAEERMYEWVTNSIVKALAFFYKEHWTAAMNDEWRKFLIVVKAMMLDGHNAVLQR